MLIMLLASSINDVIGAEGSIPWRLSDDLKKFSQLTQGHNIVMGRKTHEGCIKRVLCNRTNIVISNTQGYKSPHGEVITMQKESVLRLSKTEKLFIVGGGEIYSMFEGFYDKIYHTRVDTIIDQPNMVKYTPSLEEFTKVYSKNYQKNETNEYDFNFNVYYRVQA